MPIVFLDVGQNPFIVLLKTLEAQLAQLGDQNIGCGLQGRYLEAVFYIG
jgi:hypothetical protein